MYDAFSVALQCKGVDPALFADKCAMYRDRLSGIMTDFIQFLQDNLSAIPIVGPLISDTLLASLKITASDLQKGTASSVGDMVAMIYGIQQVIDTVSPIGTPNVIRDYLNRLVHLLAVPTECLGSVGPCSGFLKIIRMLSDGLIKSISAIPLAGALIGSKLNPLLDGLNDALALGTKAAISTSYNLLSAALSVVEVLPFFGNIAAPFRSFLELTNKLANCLV
ncbi:MAG: hypothetical protein J3R72DRAFT_450894 [Linnemannia gamsii]|nr:MAG: hypothetical protein J3R72DRAFT_450894 [Linnemannia gamsii]